MALVHSMMFWHALCWYFGDTFSPHGAGQCQQQGTLTSITQMRQHWSEPLLQRPRILWTIGNPVRVGVVLME